MKQIMAIMKETCEKKHDTNHYNQYDIDDNELDIFIFF